MALTKITANIIEDGAISTASLANTSITADKLHTTLDLTGKAVTVATATAGDNDTTVASTAFVSTAIANLADSAPATLDTLNELAAALGDDANFSTTVTNNIATKAPLATPQFTNRVGIGVAAHGTAGLNITNTDQHIRLNNGSELGIISVLSTGELELWGHGDGESINFRTGSGSGTVAMNIVGNNVGIGTSSPTRTFEVNSGTTNVVARFESTDSRAVVELKDPSGTAELGNIGNDIYFAPAGVEKVRIDSSGNVGIGTTSPSGKLGIYGGDINDIPLVITHAWGSSSTALISASNASSEVFKVERSGNVGIGTTSPSADLTLISRAYNSSEAGNSSGIRFTDEGSGSADAILQSIRVGDDGAHLLMGSNCYTATNGGIVQFDSTENSTYVDCNTYNGAIIFGTSTAGSNPDERMRIDSSGKVGIGTTSPLNKLHVDGDVHIGDGADYSSYAKLAVYGNVYQGDVALLIKNDRYNDSTATASLIFEHRTHGGQGHAAKIICRRESAYNESAGSKDAALDFYTAIGGTLDRHMTINTRGQILGGTITVPNYPGTFTAARTGSSATTTQNTWGFNATAGGSNLDFGYKAAGAGNYAYGVLNAAETAWMSRLDFAGAIHLTNTTVQSISDRRLKTDIVDANSQWNDIKALQFKNFRWKDSTRGDGIYLGLIADEVESVSPGLVGVDAVSAETMPEDGIDPEYKNVKYSILWMKATKALQEAMTRIEDLESRITELEG